ncbi:futalosine hydrolase [Streptomyces sp. NPDC093600]|uniref:futalosine hydrolase n=1 Tax=Streptomyces sp. NPDC093600 TaxID=3366047 RepID=UPI00382AF690
MPAPVAESRTRAAGAGPVDGSRTPGAGPVEAPFAGSRSEPGPGGSLSGAPAYAPLRPVVDVLVAGVGPAAAAVATATALAWASREEARPGGPDGTAPWAATPAPIAGPEGPAPAPGATPPGVPAAAPASPGSAPAPPPPGPYDLVVSAGIGGGFQPGAPLGAVVVSDVIVGADLGAQTPDGYLAVEELGFGRSVHRVPAWLTARISAALTGGAQRHTVGPVLTVSTVTGTAERAAELASRHPGAAAEAMEGFGVAEAAAAHGVPVVEIRAVSNAVGPRDRAAWRIGQAMDSLRYTFQLLSHSVFVEPAP